MPIENYGQIMGSMARTVAAPVEYAQANDENRRRNLLAQIELRQQQVLEQAAQQRQQQYAATQAQDAEEERLWDDAYARRDWGGMAKIDPQTTKVLWDIERGNQTTAAGGDAGFTLAPGSKRYKQNPDGTVSEVASVPFAPPAVSTMSFGGVPYIIDPGNRLGGGTTMPLADPTQIAGNEATIEAGKKVGSERGQQIADAPTNIRRAESNIATYENTIGAIDRAEKLASGWTTGVMSKSDFVPGTPAYDLKAELQTITANIGFDRLQRMREESPTGGALGQVAIQELTALQNSIASLDRAQSPEQFRNNLGIVRNRYRSFVGATKRAMAIERKRAGSVQGTPSAGAPAQGGQTDPLGIR